jgi:hypothetical protein
MSPEARAGEVVHFSISDIDEDETYVLEVGDRRLAEGSGNDAEEVSGQFTMPDLGGGERKVTVEAEIGERDDATTIKRKLRYLGDPAPAPAIAGPPHAPTAPVPAALTPTAGPPAPLQALTAPNLPASPAPAGRTRSKRAPRQARKRRTTERRLSPARRVERRRHGSAVKRAKGKKAKEKAKRERPRTAPLFDGVPESSGSAAAPGRSPGSLGLNAIAPPTAALTGAVADTGAHAGPAAAVLAPALLGLAALALGGTALLRSRRRSR